MPLTLEQKKELARKELAKRELEQRQSKKDDPIASAGRKITGIRAPTPQERLIDPLGALKRIRGVRETGQILGEFDRAIKSGVSTAAFDAPRALARLIGKEEEMFPEPQTEGGQTLKSIADISGLFKGGAARLGQKVFQGVKGGLIKKGAISGLVAGGAQLDLGGKTGISKKGPTLEGQALQAGFGLVTGAAIGGMSSIAKKFIDASPSKSAKFARKVRGVIFNKKREASEKFGQALDDLTQQNPDRKINIQRHIQNLSDDAFGNKELGIEGDPKLRRVINRVPKLKEIINNPKRSMDLTVKEVQDISNRIKASFPERMLKGKKGGGFVKSDEIALLDFVDDIRLEQLDAFPEMGVVRQDYGNIIGRYNKIRTKIKEGSLIKNLVNEFGDPEINEQAQALLDDDLLKEIRQFRGAVKFTDATKKLLFRGLEGAAVGTAGALAARKFLSR